MENSTVNAFVKTINNLPHAFDSMYWNMGDTSYKEQILLSFIEQNEISIQRAEKIAYKCGFSKRRNVSLFLIINGEAEDRMGMTIGLNEKAEKKLDNWRGY